MAAGGCGCGCGGESRERGKRTRRRRPLFRYKKTTRTPLISPHRWRSLLRPPTDDPHRTAQSIHMLLSPPPRLLRALALSLTAPRRAQLVSSPGPPPPSLGFAASMAAARVLAAPRPNSLVSEQREVVMDTGPQGRPLRVGLVCGGPSAERGISLNSARSVLDHIQGDDLLVTCYYIDSAMNAFAISPAQLYSNTPLDFDFKLESLAQGFDSLSDFADHLATNVDIVFPVIHGKFGEDGGIQELLERANVPFVGTPSKGCRRAFDKHNASLELDTQGFLTVPNFLVEGTES